MIRLLYRGQKRVTLRCGPRQTGRETNRGSIPLLQPLYRITDQNALTGDSRARQISTRPGPSAMVARIARRLLGGGPWSTAILRRLAHVGAPGRQGPLSRRAVWSRVG